MREFLLPLMPVAGHTIAIYAFLIVTLRVLGRRQMGQLNVIDLVVFLVMGSAVETAMVNGNTTLQAGIACAGLLFVLNWSVSRLLLRSRRFSHLVNCGPVLLVKDGRFIDDHLRKVGLTHEDVLEAIREREQPDLSHVRYAVMETDGEINVVPNDTPEEQPKQRKSADADGSRHAAD